MIMASVAVASNHSRLDATLERWAVRPESIVQADHYDVHRVPPSERMKPSPRPQMAIIEISGQELVDAIHLDRAKAMVPPDAV